MRCSCSIRRGAGAARAPTTQASHELLVSPFLRESKLCGTCHDVGNVAISKQGDGTYRYNLVNTESPSHDPWQQFPLERTYTEWKLSAFAAGGVDLGDRFGGNRSPVVATCQDCHMPTVAAKACFFGPDRNDMATHDFAGAAVPSLDLIAAYTVGDPDVNPAHVAAGRAKALSMLQRAATVELSRAGGNVVARVVNQSGHKLPTGHIEGRRVWLNLSFYDINDNLLLERGHYDSGTAHLDEATTTVYEMHVALSADAATATGLPAGVTTHMALADTIAKDTRIPPRGFNNTTYANGGAPVVGISYGDGEYWHEQHVAMPANTARVVGDALLPVADPPLHRSPARRQRHRQLGHHAALAVAGHRPRRADRDDHGDAGTGARVRRQLRVRCAGETGGVSGVKVLANKESSDPRCPRVMRGASRGVT